MDIQHQPHATANMSRYLLFVGIILVAIVSVVLAVILPRQRGDIRNQAWTSVACAGSTNVNLSACNEGCGNDSHCSVGLICYKLSGQAEGVCRNPVIPQAPNCSTPPPVTPTPIVTSTPTATPPGTCGSTCVPNATTPQCVPGMTCVPVGSSGVCRNSTCTSSTTCVCPSGSPSPTPSATPPVSGDVTMRVTSAGGPGTFAFKTLYPAGSNYMSQPSDNFSITTRGWPRDSATPSQYVEWGGVSWFRPGTAVTFEAQQPPAGWCLVATGAPNTTPTVACRKGTITVVGGLHQEVAFGFAQCTTSNWASTSCEYKLPTPGSSAGGTSGPSFAVSDPVSGPSVSSKVYDIQVSNTSTSAVTFGLLSGSTPLKSLAGTTSESVPAGATLRYTYLVSNASSAQTVSMRTASGSLQIQSVAVYDIVTGEKVTLSGYPKTAGTSGVAF